MTTKDVFKIIINKKYTNRKILKTLTHKKQKTFRKIILKKNKILFYGVKQLLIKLTKEKRNLFVVTGASKKTVDLILSKTRIANYFTDIITSENVARGKPEPDQFIFLLKKYGLKPDQCIVVEDSRNGVVAADKAGIDSILVNTNEKYRKTPNIGQIKNLLAFFKLGK